MKFIGIIGKSGSGKTTLSRMLEKDNTIGVIHLDKVMNMQQIKENMPNVLVDKNVYCNNQGEEFMMLNEKTRKIRDALIKNKLLKNLYLGILHLPREFFMKKAIDEKIKEGKDVIIIEGSTLADFAIYKKFDYLIHIDAPFAERERRAIERNDIFFDKQTMVDRDLGFRKAEKRARKKGKLVNEVIQNTGSKEDLQKVADRIYEEQIGNRRVKTNQSMQEKYGGYKTKTVNRTKSVKIKNRKKDDLSK